MSDTNGSNAPKRHVVLNLTPLTISAYALFIFIGLMIACMFLKPEYVDLSKTLVTLTLGYIVGIGSTKVASLK